MSQLHVMIQSRSGLLLLPRIREDDNSKGQFFWFLISSWGTHLLSFLPFQFASNSRWSMLSSLATSVILRGSALMMVLSCRRYLPMTDHYAPHLQGSRFLCKTSWITIALCVHWQLVGQIRCCYEFCKGSESLEDEEHSGQSLQDDNDKLRANHRSWSSSNYMSSCWRTQCGPFYHIQHLKQISWKTW